MIPTNGFYILLLDLALVATLYFALLFLWIYPDAESRGMRPRDYAIMGFMLLIFLNILGIMVLMVVYIDDRKKLPFRHLKQSRQWQAHQRGFYW